MKKRIISLITIGILLLSCACAKAPIEELYNYEVTKEPFEDMIIIPAQSNYWVYENEREAYDSCDLVIVGMPTETFTDGEQRFYDKDTNEIAAENKDNAFYALTVRNVKVISVLKGEWDKQTIQIAQEAVVRTDANGVDYIANLEQTDFIQKKNVKYIYYLKRAIPQHMDFYFADSDQGVINIDGLDNNAASAVSDNRLTEVKAKFNQEFKKYDRSGELATK